MLISGSFAIRCPCPIPCIARLLCLCFPHSAGLVEGRDIPSNAGISLLPDLLIPYPLPRETPGSPKFPSYPLEHMPWSQTPVVTRSLAITLSGLLPSEHSTSSAFTPSCLEAYLIRPQLYIFRGSIPQPASLIHLASDSRLQSCPQTSLLTCWLSFSQVGLEPLSSHSLGNISQFPSTSAELPRLWVYLGTRSDWLGELTNIIALTNMRPQTI